MSRCKQPGQCDDEAWCSDRHECSRHSRRDRVHECVFSAVNHARREPTPRARELLARLKAEGYTRDEIAQALSMIVAERSA